MWLLYKWLIDHLTDRIIEHLTYNKQVKLEWRPLFRESFWKFSVDIWCFVYKGSHNIEIYIERNTDLCLSGKILLLTYDRQHTTRLLGLVCHMDKSEGVCNILAIPDNSVYDKLAVEFGCVRRKGRNIASYCKCDTMHSVFWTASCEMAGV